MKRERLQPRAELPHMTECPASLESSCIKGTSLHVTGYARAKHKGKMVLAHRLAYCRHHNIPIEAIAGFLVRHDCDNPACINPLHLRLGSPADNSRDAKERRRTTWGERNPRAKLTESQALDALARYKSGELPRDIAREMAIGPGTIRALVQGKNWTYLTNGESISERGRRALGSSNHAAKLSEDDIRRIRSLMEAAKGPRRYANGAAKEIAQQFGVSHETVFAIATRKTWRHVA